ncbi:hypothetical protein [Salinibacter ruber]|uniref:hypothetical protein n=1 Tax=Salinibacter ruber TaxID=146919 RepID=UPI002166FA8C|nr:hypothetical protein [Salinibacter ruber]MCS4185048.1 hypothetical protein [Salinibacter ruber]
MREVITIGEGHFEKIVDINREQGSFILKVMDERVKSDYKYWMALYFHAPANSTKRVKSGKNIHQNWELLGSTDGVDKETKENLKLYVFKFVGYPRHGTMKYDGEKLAVPAKTLHKLLKEECESKEGLAEKLNETRGLGGIEITRLPNMPGYYIMDKIE